MTPDWCSQMKSKLGEKKAGVLSGIFLLELRHKPTKSMNMFIITGSLTFLGVALDM